MKTKIVFWKQLASSALFSIRDGLSVEIASVGTDGVPLVTFYFGGFFISGKITGSYIAVDTIKISRNPTPSELNSLATNIVGSFSAKAVWETNDADDFIIERISIQDGKVTATEI